MRTGTRCTTLTKLPEALSGGSMEKRAPVPPETLSTLPSISAPGKASMRTRARWPGDDIESPSRIVGHHRRVHARAGQVGFTAGQALGPSGGGGGTAGIWGSAARERGATGWWSVRARLV